MHIGYTLIGDKANRHKAPLRLMPVSIVSKSFKKKPHGFVT